MKKLLVLILCIISVNILAQDIKRGFIIGGDLSFDTHKTTSESNTKTEETENSISLRPHVGYYLNNNWMAGIGIRYINSKNEQTNPNGTYTQKDNQLAISPFVRYYTPIYNKLEFYSELEFSYGFGSEEVEQTGAVLSQKDKTTEMQVNLSPGISFDVTDWLSLEATIGAFGYSKETRKPDEDKSSRPEITNEDFFFYVELDFLMFGLQINL